MLTPTATDPNRKQQLDKQKQDPRAFGAEQITSVPKDWKEVPLKSAVKTNPAK